MECPSGGLKFWIDPEAENDLKQGQTCFVYDNASPPSESNAKFICWAKPSGTKADKKRYAWVMTDNHPRLVIKDKISVQPAVYFMHHKRQKTDEEKTEDTIELLKQQITIKDNTISMLSEIIGELKATRSKKKWARVAEASQDIVVNVMFEKEEKSILIEKLQTIHNNVTDLKSCPLSNIDQAIDSILSNISLLTHEYNTFGYSNAIIANAKKMVKLAELVRNNENLSNDSESNVNDSEENEDHND
jgi:hypothetical protein